MADADEHATSINFLTMWGNLNIEIQFKAIVMELEGLWIIHPADYLYLSSD